MTKRLLLLICSFILSGMISTSQEAPSLESFGIDSGYFAEMFADTQAANWWGIDGLMIIKGDETVLEVYRHPFDANTLHVMYSITKSFTGALTGIALEEGIISDLDTTLGEIYGTDHQITMEHLVSMTAGVKWNENNYNSADNPLFLMSSDHDPVGFFLSLDQVDEPGADFNYCSGCLDMLLAVIEENSEESALEFAQSRLLDPLGIDHFYWETNAVGRVLGGTGLFLTLPDLMRFGELYLNEGVWNGEQLILADWVEQSTQQHIFAGGGNLSGGNGYGYGWWMLNDDVYFAFGSYGQTLYIIPEYDIAIGMIGGVDAATQGRTLLIQEYILPALHHDPLPENPDAQARFAEEVRLFEGATPNPPEALPPLAEAISGEQISFDENRVNISEMTLTFDGTDAVNLDLSMFGQVNTIQVGLDGVFRANAFPSVAGEFILAGKGNWRNDTSFELTLRYMNTGAEIRMTLLFSDDDTVTVLGSTSGIGSFRLNGVVGG